MSSRVSQFVGQVARQRYKRPWERRCPVTTNMVKREKPKIYVEPVRLKAPTKDRVLSIKENAAWRYPGNNIVRATHLNLETYHDDKEEEKKLGRRKHESNFFITLNTNRHLNVRPGIAETGKGWARDVVEWLSHDEQICQYLKFGPKSAHYRNDKYEDVIQSVSWKAVIETGETLNRLHAHIYLTVHHYSQIQVNMPVMQEMFRSEYNKKASAAPDATSMALRINGKPYIQVKLLPSSNWQMVMRQYILKGMDSAQAAETDPFA